MAGGDPDALDRARPVLDSMARSVVHLGPVGTGAAMKLAVNGVLHGLNIALSEALVLAERAGIEREAAYDVFAGSAVGAPFVSYKRAAFLDPDGTPVAFALDLVAKDLELAAALADEVGAPTPQLDRNREVIGAVVAAGLRPGRPVRRRGVPARRPIAGGRQSVRRRDGVFDRLRVAVEERPLAFRRLGLLMRVQPSPA